MKIPARVYFSCWALTSIAFLVLGFKALTQHKVSIPPLGIFVFKKFLTFSLCHSCSYTLVHRLGTKIDRDWHIATMILWIWLLKLQFLLCPIPFWPLVGFGGLIMAIIVCCTGLATGFSLSVDLFVRITVLWIGGKDDCLSSTVVLFTTYFTTIIAGEQDRNQEGRLPSSGSGQAPGVGSRKGKTVRFAVAMLGSIFFQNFVQFTAFSNVLAFLCCATTWLGCLALMMSSEDFGVFDFLLSNVMVGCTVNHFGLSRPTWFAYGASVLLFGLRWGVETVRFVREQNVVLVWGSPLREESRQADVV